MSSDYQAVSAIVWFLQPQVAFALLLPLLAVIVLYIAEECGWPQFRSPKLARLYAKVMFVLTATVSPICFLCLTALVFLWGLSL
jgi:hypothetical protein